MLLFYIISSRNVILVQNNLWYLKENSAAGCKLLLMVHLPRKYGKIMDIGKCSLFKLYVTVCLPAPSHVSTFHPCHEEFCETESLQAAMVCFARPVDTAGK